MPVCEVCGILFVGRIRNGVAIQSFCGRKCYRNQNPIALFWKHVQKTDSCWLWCGAINNNGYGIFQGVSAARFSWQTLRGPVPKRREVCHNCPGGDNPLCVNPVHLFLGTHSENLIDSVRKGKNQVCKLTVEDVVTIRQMYATGKHTYSSIARQYKVDLSNIALIIQRKSWAHVP